MTARPHRGAPPFFLCMIRDILVERASFYGLYCASLPGFACENPPVCAVQRGQFHNGHPMQKQRTRQVPACPLLYVEVGLTC